MGFFPRLAALGVFCIVLVASARAATVCVWIVESGLSADAAPVEASSAWEAGIMDVFFEAGHIVTNGKSVRWADNRYEEAPLPVATEMEIEAAREGGADYLAVAILDYGKTADGSFAATRLSPVSVIFGLVELDSGTVVSEGEEVSLAKTVSGDEEARAAGRIAMVMLKGLKER